MEPQERAEIGAALAQLAAAFTGLVEVLLDGGQTKLTPQRIVDVAAKVMPRCRHAAVVVIEADRPRTLASTDVVPDHVDAVQFDAGEGPSLDVLVTMTMSGSTTWPTIPAGPSSVAGLSRPPTSAA